jgi:Zn-dependent peptidase ImmA (M78 family)
MAKQIKAIVKPALLLWARESLNLSVAESAKKIGVKEAQLSEWESGLSAPTVAQLRKAATAYKRPLAVFYLAEPPRDFEALRDFRRLPDRPSIEHTPELNLEIRRAHLRREIALELATEVGAEIPRPLIRTSALNDPSRLAREAREILGVSLDQQYGWRDKYAALNGWVSALERAGVLVFQTSAVDLDEMRGFSISEELLPVIVANAKDSPRGRVFTLAHEFTHILLNRGGLCDLRDTKNAKTDEEKTEIFCNQVAASILLPETSFLNESIIRSKGRTDIWDDDEIKELSEKYSVSQEVVLRRLLTFNRISQSFHQRKRNELIEAYRREAEASEGGFAPYHRVKIRDLGRSFVRLVLEAYHLEAINSSDVSDFLGVKLKHLSKIEHEIAGSAA